MKKIILLFTFCIGFLAFSQIKVLKNETLVEIGKENSVGLFEKNYGQPTMQFIQYINKNKKYVGKSQFLNKKQIDKIFGIGTSKENMYKKAVVKQPAVNPVTSTPNNTVQNTAPEQSQPAKTPVKTKKTRK